MKLKRGLLVVGTGRCGTNFAAEQIRACGREAHHELQGNRFGFGELHQRLSRGCSFVGWPFGAYVGPVRRLWPGQRVLCLHRDLEGFLRSTARKGWAVPDAWGLFLLRDWTDYWERYEAFMAAIKPPVLHVGLDELDHFDFQKAFDVCEE